MMPDWADRILLVGLLQGKEAWQCFRRNCRKLDQKENHLLYRSLLAARLDGWLRIRLSGWTRLRRQRCKLWGLAVRQRRRLVEQEGRGELANDLATALYNLALAHDGRGARGLAQAAAGEALEIRRRLVTGGLGAFAAEFG